MKVAISLLSVAALAACGGGTGGGGSGDDIPPSDASASASDAPPQQDGLSVTWLADPALPGTLKTDLTVSSMTVRLERLEVIGDNAQPMTSSSVQLSWVSVGDPPAISFASAPAGLYSQVNLHLDGEVLHDSYEIRGTARVNGEIRNYVIHDRNSLDIDVKGYSSQLSPGGTTAMTVKLDLRDAVSSIHFDQLEDDNGTLELDTTDQQMTMFRTKLKDAFKKGG